METQASIDFAKHLLLQERQLKPRHGEIMSDWRVTLFGKFTVECNKTRITGLEARQIQELFSYLLLFRHRPQPREALLETLWGDLSAGKARKKLRQALWRLQSTLE